MRRICFSLLLVVSLLHHTAPAQQAPAAQPGGPMPSEPTSPLEPAQKALAAGRLEEALKQLDALATITPEPAGTERLRGFVYYQQRNMSAAEAAYAKAVVQDPSDLEAMQMQGLALYSMGRPAEAIPLLEKAHVAVPSANVDPSYVLGVCYIALRRYDDARRAFAA